MWVDRLQYLWIWFWDQKGALKYLLWKGSAGSSRTQWMSNSHQQIGGTSWGAGERRGCALPQNPPRGSRLYWGSLPSRRRASGFPEVRSRHFLPTEVHGKDTRKSGYAGRRARPFHVVFQPCQQSWLKWQLYAPQSPLFPWPQTQLIGKGWQFSKPS